MAEARQRDAWDHTASLMAHLMNIHPYRAKGSVYSPVEFHPLERAAAESRRQHDVIPADITVLKVFVGR